MAPSAPLARLRRGGDTDEVRWARCPSCGGALAEEDRACTRCAADLTGELLPLQDRPGAGPPPADLLRLRPAPAPPRRVGVALGALAVALFVAGALARGEGRRARPGEVAVLGQVEKRGQPERPTTGPANVDPTRPPDAIPPGWTWRPVGPLPGRQGHVAIWTGAEVVLWGGERPGRSPEGAAYDPKADRWRPLPPMPVRINEGTGVWTGRELVVYGAFLDRGRRPLSPDDRAVGAALDPFAGRWRALPLTGESLVVWLGPSGRPHDGTWVRPLG